MARRSVGEVVCAIGLAEEGSAELAARNPGDMPQSEAYYGPGSTCLRPREGHPDQELLFP
jgi:hypothetical protein